MQSTPFISTTPLDILAGVFLVLSVLTIAMGIVIVSAIIFTALDMELYFDYKGYDIMILKSGVLPRGYGISFSQGFQVWRYREKGAAEKIEVRLFPA